MWREGLVSTIIPVFNRAGLLREAVASVLGQTYRSVEIIVVDDGSTDDTPPVIAGLAAAYPDIVRPVTITNAGPGAAREAGRRIAHGEFVQYLDSDDILLPEKFAQQIGELRKDPKADVAYGKTRYVAVAAPRSELPWKRTGERIENMFPSFLQSRWWGTSTPLYRRAITDLAGAWLPMSAEEDWEYDCRVASYGARLCYTDTFVSEERGHAGTRLSRGGSSDPRKLRDRAIAHTLILEHAYAAGIAAAEPEMRHFARELFLLARQCGAAELPGEARSLFELSLQASEPERARGLDFKAYRAAASLLGWCIMGRISCGLDAIRRRLSA